MKKSWNANEISYFKKPRRFRLNILWAIALFAIIFAGLLIWTLSTSSFYLVGGGSTSVQPILDDFTHQYRREPQGGSRIIYNSIGSAASLTGVKNKSYAFGFLSETVTDAQAQALWDEYRVLRFVIAKDYVLVIYHLPTGVTVNRDSALTTPDQLTPNGLSLGLGINENATDTGSVAQNLQALYDGTKTWGEVFPGALKGANQNQDAYGITREDGSGTRAYFEKSVIRTNNYAFKQVVSSNGEMLESIVNTPGSVGYISFAFADTIYRQFANTVHVAAVKNSVTGNWILPYNRPSQGSLFFNSQYPLFRFFTGIVNTETPHFSQVLKFLAWIIEPYAAAQTRSQLSMHNAAYWSLGQGEAPIGGSTPAWQHYNNDATKSIPDSLYWEITKRGFYTYGSPHAVPGLFKNAIYPLVVMPPTKSGS